MSHIPDEVLEAIDEFGDRLLVGTPGGMSGKLRTDLRIEIIPDSESTAICRYKTVHTQSPPVLRDRGSFMTTIIDGIDDRLQGWGIEPPGAYMYTATVDDTHHYEGILQLLSTGRPDITVATIGRPRSDGGLVYLSARRESRRLP